MTIGLGLCASLAVAQQTPSNLPPPQSDNDRTPVAPAVGAPDSGVTRQAGIGGTQAFARAGVLELGGNGSLTLSDDYKEFGLAPSIGWFFMDNWQISARASYSFAKVDGADSVNSLLLLAEPSFHMPFSNTLFGFIGIGLGLSSRTDVDIGFALVPRIGMKTLIGRSGMLTLDLSNAFMSNELIETPRGTLVTVDSALTLGAGYTVLW